MSSRLFCWLILSALAVGGVGCKKELKDEPATKKDDESSSDDDGKKKKKDKAEESDDDEGKKKKKSGGGECPGTFSEFKDFDSADEQSCTCEEDHVGGAVWGSGIYTTDSSPCAAAVHAGVIKKSGGGEITMKHAKGCDSYVGSTKNGVVSHGWTKFEGSFYFPDKGDGKCTKSDVCPSTFVSIKDKDDDTEVTCTCAPNPSGSVWGSDIYTQDSSICNAAAHSGVITKADGGSVTAKAAPGCKSYAGSSVNGVTSSSWGEYDTSFFFPSKGDGICKAPKVVTASKYKLNEVVDVLWNGAWYEGTIVAIAPNDKYRVHYSGYSSSWDEWVTLPRLRTKTGKGLKGSGAAAKPTTAPTGGPAPSAALTAAPAAGAFAAGEAVNILWKGSWYPGKIIGVNGAQYKVHYDGYSASWDEWVTAARLKKK